MQKLIFNNIVLRKYKSLYSLHEKGMYFFAGIYKDGVLENKIK